MNQSVCEILERRFKMNHSEIDRLSDEFELMGIDVLSVERKLTVLESCGLLSNLSIKNDIKLLYTLPLFRCTYAEFEFALHVPEMLSLSEDRIERYCKEVLYWSRYSDIRDKVQPLLEEIGGTEFALELIINLYISSYATVWEDRIVEICTCMIGYPDPNGLLPHFLRENWYAVFSVYSDPVEALQMIEGVFKREHVIEVFVDSVDWGSIGYLKNEPKFIQAQKYSWLNGSWESAKKKFASYLK